MMAVPSYRRGILLALALWALLLMASSGMHAQVPDSARLAPHGIDTSAAARPTRPPPDSTLPTYVMTKSPLTASLLSLALPGGGQIYNRQYWKAPIFLGAAAFFMGRALYYNGLYLDTKAEADTYPRNTSDYAFLKAKRESYRDTRDINYLYCAGVYAVAIIDAYVGAHMFDFDVGDDHTSHIYLSPANLGVGLAMRW